MTAKTFPLGTVLSVTTGLLLSPDGIGGVYEILNHMTGDNLYTHQLPRVSRECEPHLLRQFPVLSSPEMQFAAAELKEMLNTPSGEANPGALCVGWLSKLTSGRYGIQVPEQFDVEQLAPGEHYEIDPMSELAEMVHPSKIVAVIAGGSDA